MKICLFTPNTLCYPQGGHVWVYLNWALGLMSLGHEIVWVDAADYRVGAAERDQQLLVLRQRLAPYGLPAHRVQMIRQAILGDDKRSADDVEGDDAVSIDTVADAELLIDFRRDLAPRTVAVFRRSALIDTDPGILQLQLSQGSVWPPPHDLYFSIGETVGRSSFFPDGGVKWQHTLPCVSLDHWPVKAAPAGAPFTTVSHWYMSDYIADSSGDWFSNDKRSGFLPFLELPQRVAAPLELAICLGNDEAERTDLVSKGWRIRESNDVAVTPQSYHDYIDNSAGEFSCAKPSYTRWQTAWLSDRTVCYLAAGKPCIVQHTGPSRYLPDNSGLFRFHTLDEAAHAFETVLADYDRQCRLARALAEERFDARKVMHHLLERII